MCIRDSLQILSCSKSSDSSDPSSSSGLSGSVSDSDDSSKNRLHLISLGAVSYTHLDVYKRQLLGESISENKESENGKIKVLFLFDARVHAQTRICDCNSK